MLYFKNELELLDDRMSRASIAGRLTMMFATFTLASGTVTWVMDSSLQKGLLFLVTIVLATYMSTHFIKFCVLRGIVTRVQRDLAFSEQRVVQEAEQCLISYVQPEEQ